MTVTHVARSWVIGSHVCVVYPRGRRMTGGPAIEGGADYEAAWNYAGLFRPTEDVLELIVAWMERASD